MSLVLSYRAWYNFTHEQCWNQLACNSLLAFVQHKWSITWEANNFTTYHSIHIQGVKSTHPSRTCFETPSLVSWPIEHFSIYSNIFSLDKIFSQFTLQQSNHLGDIKKLTNCSKYLWFLTFYRVLRMTNTIFTLINYGALITFPLILQFVSIVFLMLI